MLLSLEAGSSIFVFVPVFDTMVKRAAAKSRAQQMGPPPSAQPEAECLADRGFQRQTQSKVSRAEGFKAKVKAATLKCIRDNFRDFSDEEVYHVRPEGTQKKMYEQIYNDKWLFFTKAKNAPKLGCKWTADLRTTYHVVASVDEDALNPKDENVQASAMLQEVCDASRSQQADRSRLISWLQRQNSLPNQTEICGLFLHRTELKPWHDGTGHDLCLEMLKYVVRLDLHTHFPAECAAVKHQFDKTMVQSWSVMRGKGYTPGGFWSGNAQWCGPLLNVEFVSRLLRVQANDWTGHEGEVATVVGSCMLGARLFQHASDKILKRSCWQVH